jgi:hypothetical protein
VSDSSPAPLALPQSAETKKESLIESYKRTLDPWLEPLTKVAAVWLILTYVAGYLIVSIYESSFGFTELNPFKPKILAAGILFMFLTFLAVFGASAAFREYRTSTLPWSRKMAEFGISALLYYYATFVLAGIGLAFLSTDADLFVTTLSGSRWMAPLIVFVLAVITYISPKMFGEKRFQRILSTTVGIGSPLIIIFWIYLEWKFSKDSAGFAIHLWLFILGTLVVTNLKDAKQMGTLRPTNLNQLVIASFLPLLLFARGVYPKIKISFGGGEKIPIVLFFTKDSSLKPNESLNVQLIEESESGFYFLPKGSSKAVFVPRAFVSMVSFSDSTPAVK